MAFGSNDFPLGPNGRFPRKRVGNFGGMIAPPNRIEDVYRRNVVSKLPVVEKEYSSTVERAKGRMKAGSAMRIGQRADKFSPRYLATRLIAPVMKARRMGASIFSGGLQGIPKFIMRKIMPIGIPRGMSKNQIPYQAIERQSSNIRSRYNTSM